MIRVATKISRFVTDPPTHSSIEDMGLEVVSLSILRNKWTDIELFKEWSEENYELVEEHFPNSVIEATTSSFSNGQHGVLVYFFAPHLRDQATLFKLEWG